MGQKSSSIGAISLVSLFASLAAMPAIAETQEQNTSLGIEFESEIKRDVRAYVDFMLNTAYPLYEAERFGTPLQTIEEMEQIELAKEPAAFFEYTYAYERILRYRMLDRLLDGCYGEPGLADYAWTANAMATFNYSHAELIWARDFAVADNSHTGMTLEERQAFYEEYVTLRHNSNRWIDDLNALYLDQNPEILQRLYDLDYHARTRYTEEIDISGFGLRADHEGDLSVVFGSNSRFMIDPDYSERVSTMMSIPAEEYRERKWEEPENGGFTEPSVLYDFDHNRACLPK